MPTTSQPLALPDTPWAARLLDAIEAMDGARDHYTISIQTSGPVVRIWAANPHDAADAATFFNATVDATATSDRTLVMVRHYTDEPDIQIVTARTTALDGAA